MEFPLTAISRLLATRRLSAKVLVTEPDINNCIVNLCLVAYFKATYQINVCMYPGGGGVLPNMGYIGMCGPKG